MHSDTQVPNTHNHGSLSFSQGMFAIGEHKTIFSRIRAASFRRWCFLLSQYGYLHNGLQSFSQGPECGLWIFLDIIPCTNFFVLNLLQDGTFRVYPQKMDHPSEYPRNGNTTSVLKPWRTRSSGRIYQSALLMCALLRAPTCSTLFRII